MEQRFKAGDYLFFQLEAGFALFRLLGVTGPEDDPIWHVSAFQDLFPDVEMTETATTNPASLSISLPHVAITNRAFESTQVAAVGHSPVTNEEKERLLTWQNDPDRTVSDLSIRLLTGLR